MKWKIIGHVLIVDKDIDDPERFIHMQGDMKRVRTVARLDYIQGYKREPVLEVLAGDKDTETIHKEHGCFFKFDVSRIMWSKGNTSERMRVAGLVGDGERVLDMFAGIGYFSIPIGVHSNVDKVYSIEINPVSYNYLKENIVLNKVEDSVEAFLGDSNILAADFKPVDRVLMGYVHTTHDFLASAIGALGDKGVIHYHETVPDKLIDTRPVERIKKAADGREVSVLGERVIKKYSPGVSHVVVDAMIE